MTRDDTKSVSLNFKGQGIFKDTNTPFKSLKNPITGRQNTALKDEYDSLVAHINQFDITGVLDTEAYMDSGVDVTIDLKTVNATPSTFTFFGMDVTGDLGVFLKGSYISVYVGNLIHQGGLEDTSLRSSVEASSTLFPTLMKVLTKDTVKIAIEKLKHENFMTLEDTFANSSGEHYADRETGYTFLDHIVEAMIKGSEDDVKFNSVTLNYVGGSFLPTTKEVATDKEVSTYVYETVLGYWLVVLDRYKYLSALLSAYSLFLDILKRAFGKDAVADSVKSAITQGSYADIGCFEGFAKGGIIQGRQMTLNLAENLMESISAYKAKGYITYPYPASVYATTMFDYPNTADISTLTLRECVAYSVLDTLKFVDKDLELITDTYDMNNSEDREVFLKSTIKGYKKKFENYLSESIGMGTEKEISRAVIENILPKNEDSVDILNVNKTVDGTPQNIDVEVSRVSFNKTNLLKACQLIYKVLNMLTDNFKSSKP